MYGTVTALQFLFDTQKGENDDVVIQTVWNDVVFQRQSDEEILNLARSAKEQVRSQLSVPCSTQDVQPKRGPFCSVDSTLDDPVDGGKQEGKKEHPFDTSCVLMRFPCA